MTKLVLDASALLALLYQEPGHEKVASSMSKAVMSAVNVSEVLAVLYAEGVPENQITQDIVNLVTEVIDFDSTQAKLAASLRKPTKALGLSLGERACLALAQSLKLPALTADKLWSKLKLDIEIQLIR